MKSVHETHADVDVPITVRTIRRNEAMNCHRGVCPYSSNCFRKAAIRNSCRCDSAATGSPGNSLSAHEAFHACQAYASTSFLSAHATSIAATQALQPDKKARTHFRASSSVCLVTSGSPVLYEAAGHGAAAAVGAAAGCCTSPCST
jgi:hypothetical protein